MRLKVVYLIYNPRNDVSGLSDEDKTLVEQHVSQISKLPDEIEILLLESSGSSDTSGSDLVSRCQQKYDVNITYLQMSSRPQGTAGLIDHFKQHILTGDPEAVFVINDRGNEPIPFEDMLCEWEENPRGVLTLTTDTGGQGTHGYVVTDHENKVVNYIDMRRNFRSADECIGVYLINPEVIKDMILSPNDTQKCFEGLIIPRTVALGQCFALRICARFDNICQIVYESNRKITNLKAEDRGASITKAYEAFEKKEIAELCHYLNAGVQPDEMINKDGQTPLHVAISNGQRTLAILLLSYGADPMKKDAHGLSAYDMYESHMERESFLDPQIENICTRIRSLDMTKTGIKSGEKTVVYGPELHGRIGPSTFQKGLSHIRQIATKTHGSFRYVTVATRLISVLNFLDRRLKSLPSVEYPFEELHPDLCQNLDRLVQLSTLAYDICDALKVIKKKKSNGLIERLKMTMIVKGIIEPTDDVRCDFMEKLQNKGQKKRNIGAQRFKMPKDTNLRFNNAGMNGLFHHRGRHAMFSVYLVECIMEIFFEDAKVKRDFGYLSFALVTPQAMKQVKEEATKVETLLKTKKKVFVMFACEIPGFNAYHSYLAMITKDTFTCYNTSKTTPVPTYAKRLHEELSARNKRADMAVLRTPTQRGPYDCAIYCLLMVGFHLQGLEFTEEDAEYAVPRFRSAWSFSKTRILSIDLKRKRKGKENVHNADVQRPNHHLETNPVCLIRILDCHSSEQDVRSFSKNPKSTISSGIKDD